MAAERVLTAAELNRTVLARQLLLGRAELDVPAALESVAGIQDQYAPSGYIGLWSRVAGFRRDDLTTALEQRSAVQATVMRDTIHLLSAGDFPALCAAVREARRAWWRRTSRTDGAAAAAAAEAVRRALADGPRRRADLLGELGLDTDTWNGAQLWVDLVRVPPSGTWEHRRADLFGLADHWVGPSTATLDDGLDLAVRRYLGGFGPAAPRDIAGWAGLPVRSIAPALARLDLRRYRGPTGERLVDLPDAEVTAGDAPVPVRFLPTWDAILLVHARRSGVLAEADRSKVFANSMPQSVGTYLVDGRVAGTWSARAGSVHVEPFAEPVPTARAEVADEADRLAAFMA